MSFKKWNVPKNSIPNSVSKKTLKSNAAHIAMKHNANLN